MLRQFLNLNSARLIFDGNSITANAFYGHGDESRIPEQVQFQLARQGIAVDILNVAVGAQTGAQMIADASLQVGAVRQRHRNEVVIVNEGGNDLIFGASAEAAFQNIRNYCLLRQSEGYYVLVWSCLDRQQSTAGPPAISQAQYNALLLEFNNKLASGWREFADSFIDIREELPYLTGDGLPYDAQPSHGMWLPDAVHPSATGHAMIAAKICEALKRIRIRQRSLLDMPAQIFTFNTAGAFSLNIPPNCTTITIAGFGGGGGGASGRKSAAAVAAYGGGGGGSSGWSERTYALGELPGLVPGAQLQGFVGAGGAGGAAQATNSTNGLPGAAGGNTYIQIGAAGALLFSTPGGNGATSPPSTTTGSGASNSGGDIFGQGGGASVVTGTPAQGSGAWKTGGGGAGGGGIDTANVPRAGGQRGAGNQGVGNVVTPAAAAASTTANGANGANGGENLDGAFTTGNGGGGGGASSAANFSGGNGGNGGPGGGGGGGGAARDGTGTSGAGGAGGPGAIQIVFY